MQTTKKKKILWLDDDIFFYESFLQELKEFYEIELYKNPDEFWRVLLDHPKEYFAGIILDVLLPYGTTITADQANGGLRTGMELLKNVKATVDYRDIPVVIFTIRDSRDVDEVGEKFGVPILRKQDTDLDEFVATIRGTLGDE